MEQAYHRVREHLSAGHQRQKDIYDKHVHGDPYQEGDIVWLLDPVVAEGQSKKFHHPWKGPFRVLKKIETVIILLSLDLLQVDTLRLSYILIDSNCVNLACGFNTS